MNYIIRLLFLGLLAGACHPKDTPQPDPVPTNLLVEDEPDSVLTLTEQVDFSPVSEIGRCPTGALIRWDAVDSPSRNYTAYTYNQKGWLIGSCEGTSYGYNRLAVAAYQGRYLAKSFDGIGALSSTQDATTGNVQLTGITKYEYAATTGQLKQLLYYLLVGEKFKLFQRIQYDYKSTGELYLTRHKYGPAFKDAGPFPTTLAYWEDGNRIRSEIYQPTTTPQTSIDRVFYTQQANPVAHLNLIPVNQRDEHYPLGTGPSASGPREESYQYRYQYDSQGRLVTMRSRSLIAPGWWTQWDWPSKFTYAP